MRTTPSQAVLAGVCTSAALALIAAPTAAAAPYTPDALLTVSVTTPLLGGTLTITILNFETGELIDIDITGIDSPLTTVTANKNGSFSTPISLPRSLRCDQTLTATGRESGKVARTNLVIGSLSTCDHADAKAARATSDTGAWKSTSYAAAPTDQTPAVAAAAVAGLAAVGGAGFLARRRTRAF